MKMENERESANLEDRRGQGGGSGRRIGIGGGAGIGGIGLVAVMLISMLFGVDPGVVLSAIEGGGAPVTQQAAAPGATRPPGDDAHARFVSRVLASTEDVWAAEFARANRRYEPPRMVLFSGAVQSGCGAAQSAMGPFYCPADRRVYIDLSFFREMERRLGAPGDFAQAYVIAHEVGHHVQNLLGRLQSGHGNAASVRTELQADCLAGFWARRADEMRGILERGDIEEGMGAAAAVGDDRLQQASRGRVVPESFTHGSSAQRVHAFKTGMT